MSHDPLDLAGIGIGPFNLSVAALLAPIDEVRATFFDRKPEMRWHSGLMLPGASLQTSWLKDLVSAVAPTSPYSFTAYLVAKKRFYRFLNADFARVPRQEFANYLRWVADQLPSLNFQVSIEELDFDDEYFVLRGNGLEIRARNILLGTGVRPHIPDWARRHLGTCCFHAGEIVHRLPDLTDKTVAVVGGGQTGAEVFLHLLSDHAETASRVLWLNRRPNFLPIDETAFTNEYFTPGYIEHFFDLPASRKVKIVEQQRLAGDGISDHTIRDIYQRLYVLNHLNGASDIAGLLPNREVVAFDHDKNGYVMTMRNGMTGGIETAHADVVILATGFEGAMPDCLGPLQRRIRFDGQGNFRLSRTFAVDWDGPATNRIYAQNAGRYSHGIADPQLSVMAWRSGVIINDLLDRRHYDTEDAPDLVNWRQDDEGVLPLAAQA